VRDGRSYRADQGTPGRDRWAGGSGLIGNGVAGRTTEPGVEDDGPSAISFCMAADLWNGSLRANLGWRKPEDIEAARDDKAC